MFVSCRAFVHVLRSSLPNITGRQLSATRRDLLENHPNAGNRDPTATGAPDDYDVSTPLLHTEANSRQPGMLAPLPPTSPRASPIVSPQAFLSNTRSHQLMKVRPNTHSFPRTKLLSIF